MTSTIRCDIVSAEQDIFSGSVKMVVVTGEMGELGIAPKHAPLITRIKPGFVRITLENDEHIEFYVSGGILEVQPQLVSVLADTAVRAAELDGAKAQHAKEEAERILANRTEATDLEDAQRTLEQAMAQLQALERLRKNLKH
jgi:F-type H+-transporting ATPase subunit epsilon